MDHLPVLDSYEGVTAIVEYDYKAKEVDELDLVKGQIIHNIIQQPGGWWEGTLTSTGRTGMFPDNFVRVLDTNDNNTVVLREKSSAAQRRCRAIYSYTQVNEDELSLAVGDVIEFLGEVEEGWWRGKINNKIGVFPSNFVVGMQVSPVFASKRPTHALEPTATSANKPNTTLQKIPSDSLNKSQTNFKEDVLSNNRTAAIADSSSDKYTAPVLPPRPVREFCRVEFPYSPQNEDELELVTGELIAIVSKELPDKGWWKGELNGKVGVFPDNFVKLVPLDDSPVKDSKITQADSTAKTITKKTSNSIIPIPGPGRLESFGSRDSLDDILSETGLQSGNVAAQRKSLENKNFELTTPSSSVDRTSKHLDIKSGETRKSIENLDEKKAPPPLLTKKPTVPGKKSSGVTNVASNLISGLRQKVRNVEQKPTLSQDTNDGVVSSKSNIESFDNNEKGNGIDSVFESEHDFDKVERASILPDMRAGRVKAPKRRPPSVATNLSVEGTSRNSIYLNGIGDSLDELKNPPSSNTDSEQQVKPKSREWEKKKVPWISELKASQEKKKTSPNIEPRTTLVDTSTKTALEEKQNVSSIIPNSNKTKMVVDSNSITSGQTSVTKSTTSLFQTVSADKKIESEVEISKSVSEVVVNKTLVKESIITAEDNEVKVPPKTFPAKLNVNRLQSQQLKSTSSSIAGHNYESNDVITPEPLKLVELEKRVQSLEAVVQLQQKTIEDLMKLLHEESDRVENLKNQLEKYAQCVTQV